MVKSFGKKMIERLKAVINFLLGRDVEFTHGEVTIKITEDTFYVKTKYIEHWYGKMFCNCTEELIQSVKSKGAEEFTEDEIVDHAVERPDGSSEAACQVVPINKTATAKPHELTSMRPHG